MSIAKTKTRYGSRGWRLQPQLSIANTNVHLLNKCKEILGIGHVYNQGRIEENWKELKSLHIYKMEDMLSLLKQLEPYLITKREQAKLLIEFVEIQLSIPVTAIFNERGKFQGTKGKEYSQRQLEIHDLIKKLNKKGRVHENVG